MSLAQEVVGSWRLVQYTHDHLPEWQDPGADPVGPASRPLPLENILTALGKEDNYIQEVVARVKVSNQLDESCIASQCLFARSGNRSRYSRSNSSLPSSSRTWRSIPG